MKLNRKWIYLIIIVVGIILLVVLLNSNQTTEEEEEVKDVTFTTSDNKFVVTASEEFKKKSVSDYDLYLTKDDKEIVGFFTYNLSDYEESTSKEILDKQISYFTSTRTDFKLFKKESTIELDDKTITKVEYEGTNNDSSNCVYVFAVIDFKSDTNYVVYANEVILHSEYEKNIGEMINILKNAKIN